MIKNIKRVGIIFLAVAIICLMIIGCLIAGKVSDNSGVNLANDQNVAIADEEFVPDVTLDSASTIVSKWNNAINTSMSGNKQIKVLLDVNWNYVNSSEKHIMGTGVGFATTGSILVPKNANIILNLNGKNINRGLIDADAITDGEVIRVEGKLQIVDSTYNHEAVQNSYDLSKEYKELYTDKLNRLVVGRITGGASLSNAGGILVYGASAKLNMYGGMIYNNYTKVNGGGICVIQGVVDFYDGVIYNNTAGGSSSYGGGICAYGGTTNIHSGFVVANNSQWYGAGVANIDFASIDDDDYIQSKVNILGGIISHNYGRHGGGVANTSNSKCVISGGAIISYNYVFGSCAGILAWGQKYADEPTTELYDCIITNNTTYFSQGLNGGSGVLSNSILVINGTEIISNDFINVSQNPAKGGGIFITHSSSNNTQAKIENVTITGNSVKSDINDGLHSQAGGMAFSNAEFVDVVFSGSINIYDNTAHGVPSDLRIEVDQKMQIVGSLTNGSNSSRIGIELADEYGKSSFTDGYSASGNTNPNIFFSSNGLAIDSNGALVANDKAEVPTIVEGEVRFENTISSDVYEFIYYENGKRKSYSDNNMIHAVNDYDLRKVVNNGDLVLGNILPNTSVNSFASNIKFAGSKFKIVDGNNNIVYGDGADVKFENLLDNGYELAIGTGWRLQTFTENDSMIEEFYLSVLGDLTGDGKVNSADVNYLRQLINNADLYNTLLDKSYIQLAALIVNKNGVSQSDANILWNVTCGIVDIEYFI